MGGLCPAFTLAADERSEKNSQEFVIPRSDPSKEHPRDYDETI